MNAIEKVVLKDAHDYGDKINYLEAVCRHGCISGIVPEMIYYRDTRAFYEQHKDIIATYVKEIQDDTGMPIQELFRDFDEDDPFVLDDKNQNILACFAYEFAASQLLAEDDQF